MAGNGGDVDIHATAINLLNGGEIDASTFGPGVGGSVHIHADSLNIGPRSYLSANSEGTGNGGSVFVAVSGPVTIDAGATGEYTAISSESGSTSPGAGSGGNVTIQAGSLNVLGGAEIDATSFGPGTGGDVILNITGDTMVDGGPSGELTSIAAQTQFTTTGGGPGGNVKLSTGTLEVLNGGDIDATTFGMGTGGDVNVIVRGTATIDAGTTGIFTAISSQTKLTTAGAGPGGDVTLQAGTLNVLNGGAVDASTFGTGSGGNVNVTVSGVATIDAGTTGVFTSISAETKLNVRGAGRGGDVTLQAATLDVHNGGAVDASTFGKGPGGRANVTVSGNTTIDGGSAGLLTAIAAQSRSTTAGAGAGGDVTFSSGSLNVLNGGRSSTPPRSAPARAAVWPSPSMAISRSTPAPPTISRASPPRPSSKPPRAAAEEA